MEHEKKPLSSSQKPPSLLGLLGALAFYLWAFLSAISNPKQNSGNSANSGFLEDTTTDPRQDGPKFAPIRVIVESVPEPLPPTPKEEANANRKEGREKQNLWTQRFIAFFAFAYATVAIFQWYEMRSTIAAAADQFRQDQRPYVWTANAVYDGNGKVIKQIGGAHPVGMNLPVSVGINIQNFGRSPAKIVRTYYATEFGADALSRVRQLSWKTSLGEKNILPGGGVTSFEATSTKSITDDRSFQDAFADYGIVTFAVIQYEDISGHLYESDLCYFRSKNDVWLVCETHNDIKDCSRDACAKQ